MNKLKILFYFIRIMVIIITFIVGSLIALAFVALILGIKI